MSFGLLDETEIRLGHLRGATVPPMATLRWAADEIERLREAIENVIGSWEYDGDLTRHEIEELKKVLAQ